MLGLVFDTGYHESMQISVWEQFVSISDEEDRLSYPVFLEPQVPSP